MFKKAYMAIMLLPLHALKPRKIKLH